MGFKLALPAGGTPPPGMAKGQSQQMTAPDPDGVVVRLIHPAAADLGGRARCAAPAGPGALWPSGRPRTSRACVVRRPGTNRIERPAGPVATMSCQRAEITMMDREDAPADVPTERPPPEVRNPARVFVSVGLKSWVGAAPHHVWVGEFEIAESELADLRREVEAVVRPAAYLDSFLPSYQISVTRGRTSWGADSGEVVSAILWIGEAVTAGLLGAGALKLLRSLAGRDSGMHSRVEVSRDEAISRARWVVTSRYGVDARDSLDSVPDVDSDLTLIGESYDAEAGAWTISLRDVDGTDYQVRFGHLSGLPTVNEITRSQRTNP